MKFEAGAVPASVAPRVFTPLVPPPPDAERFDVMRGRPGSRRTETVTVRSVPSPASPVQAVFGRPPAENRLEVSTPPAERLPEVHISIGRIEVTAARSPPSKPVPTRAHKTMPLKEYLERRVREKR